jgi:tetratricopeptide (TPR) repeat protein
MFPVSDVVCISKSNSTIVNAVLDLCKLGLYCDALSKAQKEWGEINTWTTQDQLLIAIRLYMNLGGDRKSDALLLKLWRNNKECPVLLNKIFFYKLNKCGPILTSEFVKQHDSVFSSNSKNTSDFLGFKSIIQRIFKNYYQADMLLDKAIVIDPSDTWLTSLKIQLQFEQNENSDAQQQAENHFSAYPSAYNMRAVSNILTKREGTKASIEFYEKHINQYQSASVLFEYASLLAGNHEWLKCEQAIIRFEQIRIVEDKLDNKFLIQWKAQISIHKQEIDKALTLLSPVKHGYWKIVCNNLKKSKGKLNRKILNVPFIRQEHMTCAPTTLSALCKYWGDDYSSKDIADKICFDGTPDTKERQWLRDKSYVYKEFELESELAYSLIDSDIPFALVTTDGFSSHIQAVIGYNQQIGTIYIMDPSNAIMQEMLTKETIESEGYSGARCIAFVPQDKSELLSSFTFPASELYVLWDNYSVAEDKKDYISAKYALEALQKIDENHRITLRVKRSFAIWNNETAKILALNNRLLDRFPNQTLLLNSKYVCLRDLGNRKEGLQLLSDYLSKNINIDLLATLLAEVHDTNDHNDIKDLAVQKLKMYGGYSAYSHWTLANCYWAQQAFEVATEHYLYAYCLDETNSQYIESYFKASRHLKKDKEALAFLKLRFNKYKVRSHLPAVSLYQAYELLDQEHIGVEYLFEALDIHENDISLLSFLGKKLIDKGLIARFESISTKLKSTLGVNEYNELIAWKDEKSGDFEAALQFYSNSFNRNPFIYNHANGYFRLLLKRGDTQQLDKVLEELYKTNNDNTQVLDYIADWHTDPVFREKVLAHFVNVRPDYGVIRRQLVDVRIQLGQFDKALETAKDTCNIIIGEHINTSYLAKCYFKIGDFNQSKALAKQVLLQAVDNDLAYTVLMDASQTQQEKVSSLKFLFEQIKEQVVFGDSAWNFWFGAKSVLSQDTLKEFIDYLLIHNNHLWYSYSIAGNYYKQYDDLKEAFTILKQGINKFPLTPRLYNDLGQLYELLGNIAETQSAYQEALVMNPAWSDVTKRLSDVLEKHDSFDSAIEIIENGIKHNPDDGVLHGYLADLLIKVGKEKEAVNALKKAVKHSTDYRWAWNELNHLCKKLKRENEPHHLALELSKQSPYLAHVWRDLAYVTKDSSERLSLIEKAIECDRFYIPAYQDKTQFFINQGEYKQALSVLDTTPWQTELPSQLRIQKIDLFIDIGQKELAVEQLKSVLYNAHGYAYLWSKLFSLIEGEGNKDDYIACCHKSVEQNRHDPDILCYAGENLLKHGSSIDKEAAKDYLQKAYTLAPNEQYVVLTYIDCLIFDQKYESALNVIEAYESHEQVVYAETRKIKILCKLKRFEEALNKYKILVLDQDVDYWCLDQGFSALNEKYNFDELADIYKDNANSLSKVQSYFYIDKCLNVNKNKKYKHVLKEIDKYDDGDHWNGAFIALLEFFTDNDITPPDNVVDKYLDRIVKSPVIIEQLGGGYINAGHYHSMIKLFERVEIKEQLSAFVFYHYRLALQMLGRWDDSTNVIIQGLKKEPDSTVHNLRLWYAYDLVRTGEQLTKEDIEVIDYSSLIEMEQYVYSTLVATLALGNSSLESKLEELNPLLRNCQQCYQNTGGQELALHARKSLKARLKKAMQSKSLFKSIKLSLWISNRF